MTQSQGNFSEQIKDVRQQLGLSQETLAQALGVSFARVNCWENSWMLPSKLAQRQFEQFCMSKKEQGDRPDDFQ